ncbi:Sec34-domain-containing protein [Sanghuangporus baumii]|uniref:Conserved oligomeric Golgi complex subunit 3 n=1 Tax=Sanghuangporus baumii TaxID=108892 RepID=A0A9Q5N3H9_SANBA|nr:Sec34-domain-containing protein [Sanghuangporus baumii]
MAAVSLRTPASRTGTPSIPSPHPKQIISLEDWEAKAPLSDTELKSISAVQDSLKDKSLIMEGHVARYRLGSPGSGGDGTEPLRRSETPITTNGTSSREKYAIPPGRPVQTPQEFYDWFSMIERSVAHSQEAHYRDYLATLDTHLSTCQSLVEGVHSVSMDVDDMLDGWRSVESGGRSLKEACEELLDERDRVIQLAEDIGARLEYFQELEHATRMLNHPGDSLVLQSDFLNMVERVDICIDFLRAHRHYREAEIYLLRFQQCLTRAMTLIKMYFVGSLKALTSDILRRIPSKEISATAQEHLLYTRFQSVSVQVAPLIGELERRTQAHPEKLSALLAECHSAYFSARKSLLSSRLAEEIKGLDPGRSDLVELTRAGCSYLKQLCVDEFTLFRCFFNSGKEMLYAYLESLCDYLYDDLRPRILHEQRLSVLCNVCKVLQALMVLDVSEIDSSSDEEDEYEGNGSSGRQDNQTLGKLHISHMLQSVLQDAQTRLLFKAQNVIQAEIRYYVPKPEDLDHPQKLQDAFGQSHRNDETSREDGSPFSRLSSFEERGTWYTPLQTMTTILTQLHEFIQPSIFNDIAEEAIGLCRVNLITAASMIATRTSPPEELDAQLFLIRHLLVLKEMIGVLNLGNRSLDGTFELRHVAEALRDMLRSSNFIPYAFAGSSAKAQDGSTSGGVKEDVDGDLRRACEFVIQLCARTATQPIQDFMLSLDGSSMASGASKSNLSKQGEKPASATRSGALDVEEAFRATLERAVPQTAARLRLYLGNGTMGTRNETNTMKDRQSEGTDSGIVSVLLGHVQERIVDAFVAFRQAAEFLPAVETSRDGEESSSGNDSQEKRTFSSPEDIRTLLRALC